MKSAYCFLLIYLLIEIAQSSVYANTNTEQYNSGWQFNIDNNILQEDVKDRDYTSGIAFTASGSRAQSGWLNIDPVRA